MHIFFILLFLIWAGPTWAEQNIPVKITSDTMRYTQQADEIVFTGKVHVLREDVNIWSDTLTVLLEKQKENEKSKDPLARQGGNIKRLIAVGNVRMKAENDRSGTCGKATYEAASEVLTMEDDPILMEGQNTIQGEVIKVYVQENRSEVIGGKKRVEAIFMTQDKKPGQNQ